jgi:hypothetical protein
MKLLLWFLLPSSAAAAAAAAATKASAIEVYHTLWDTYTKGQRTVDVSTLPWEYMADDFVVIAGALVVEGKQNYQDLLKTSEMVIHHDYWHEFVDENNVGYMFISVYARAPNQDKSTMCHHQNLALHKVTVNEQNQLASLEITQDGDFWACLASSKEEPFETKKTDPSSAEILDVYHSWFSDDHVKGQSSEQDISAAPWEFVADDIVVKIGPFQAKSKDAYIVLAQGTTSMIIHHDRIREFVDIDGVGHTFLSVYAEFTNIDCRGHSLALHKYKVNEKKQLSYLEMIMDGSQVYGCYLSHQLGEGVDKKEL